MHHLSKIIENIIIGGNNDIADTEKTLNCNNAIPHLDLAKLVYLGKLQTESLPI